MEEAKQDQELVEQAEWESHQALFPLPQLSAVTDYK